MSEVIADKLAENEQQRPLPQRPPTIPQGSPAAEDSLSGLIEQAKAATAQLTPAQSVAERFGAAPGADIGTTSRRPGPAARAEPSLLDLTPQERAMVIRLGTAAGKFDENGTAKAAHENAAWIAALVKDGRFTTTEDPTPGRRVNPQGVAGYTAGQSYGR